MLKKYSIAFILSGFVLLIGIIVFFKINNSKITSNNQTKKLIPVRLALAKGILTLPVMLAYHKKYFTNAGLSVEINDSYSSGRQAFEAMLQSKADISTVATTPVVVYAATRKDFSLFATYTTSYEGIRLVVRKDRAINKPIDLKGKKVGVVKGTISEFLLNSILVYNKILPYEVTVIYAKAPKLLSLFGDGKVDAIVLWEPFASYALIRSNNQAKKMETSRVYRMAINLSVMNLYAKKNPEVLEKIIMALVMAVDYINKNRNEAVDISSQLLSVNKKLISSVWDSYTHAITLDQLLIYTMEYEARWYAAYGGRNYKRIPNFLDYIYYPAMEKIIPKAITIIRK